MFCFNIYLFIYLAASSLSCDTCAPECVGSVFVARRLHNVPWHYVPLPGMKPMTLEFQGRFLTTGRPGKSFIVLFLTLLRDPQLFHGGYSNLHPHQQCTRFPFSQYPHQYLLSVVFNNSHSDSCEVIISLWF